MKKIEKKINIYYVAGLFDGEGWFRINRQKGTKNRTNREWAFQSYAHLCMREKSIILMLKHLYGGSVTLKKGRRPQHSDAWQWNITCKGLDDFIKSIDGKLIAKQKQLKIIKTFRSSASKNACLKMTDKRYKTYTKCYRILKQLNKKGIGKK